MPLTEIKAALSRFEYFDKWDETTITLCCNLAKIKKYPKDTVILGDSFGFPNYVYFVLTGECKVIEELFVIQETSKNNVRYKLHIPSLEEADEGCRTQKELIQKNQKSVHISTRTASNSLPPNTEVHFVQVCIFSPLSCFGFGEHMERRRVITTAATECLLIPYYWLMQQNVNNIWNRIQIFLKRIVPTTEQVFNEFVSQRLWDRHRQNLVHFIISKKKRFSNNSLYNVPYYIRINNIT